MPSLQNEDNRQFITSFKKDHKQDANLFALQGWEVALLLLRYLQQQTNGATAAEAIAQMKRDPVHSPRGLLQITNNHAVIAPAYLVTASHALQEQIEDVVEDTSAAWKDMMAQVPDQAFASWQNT